MRFCGFSAIQSLYRTTPRTLWQTRLSVRHDVWHNTGSLNRRRLSTSLPGDSTIFALSTASGRAAIAIVRISGPACSQIYHSLCPDAAPLRPRVAAVRKLFQPRAPPTSAGLLDSGALCLYFDSPKTSTGEDVLELHVHGGTAVVKAVIAAVASCDSPSAPVRYAEPGEFTRRAFLHDRLDLTQVEALGDVLSASTEQQRRLSVRGSTGVLAQRYDEWRGQLLHARGELEALIDFSEDQHFDESPSALTSSVAVQVRSLLQSLNLHLQNAVRGELLRNGIGIAFLGAPNAGKSSLLNSIVGREAAIVSQEAGTTRDVVEVGIDLGGYLCRLGDTAGLRSGVSDDDQTIGLVEQEGMRRAKAQAEKSDFVILVCSVELVKGEPELKLDPEVVETANTVSAEKQNLIVVLNKVDLLRGDPAALEAAQGEIAQRLPHVKADQIFPISCIDAENAAEPDRTLMTAFLAGLVRQFEAATSPLSSDAEGLHSLGASERHRLLLVECRGHLEQFLEATSLPDEGDGEGEGVDVVLAAEHLRAAASCLARITGRGEGGDVEEVLGVVFEK